MRVRTKGGKIAALFAACPRSKGRQNTIEAAVDHCEAVMLDAFKDAVAEGYNATDATIISRTAYRQSLPRMRDADSIQAYIACVANGIDYKIWTAREATTMMYAAQVAMNAFRTAKSLNAAGRPKGKQAAR